MKTSIIKLFVLGLLASGVACSNGGPGFEDSENGSESSNSTFDNQVSILFPDYPDREGNEDNDDPQGGGGPTPLADSQATAVIRTTYQAILMRQPSQVEISRSLDDIKYTHHAGMRRLAISLADYYATWVNFQSTSSTHIIHSLYAGLLNRCGEANGVHQRQMTFGFDRAGSSAQRLSRWIKKEIDIFLSSAEFRTNNVFVQLMNSNGLLPVCLWGEAYGRVGGNSYGYYYSPYAPNYTTLVNPSDSVSLRFFAIGGNGSHSGRYSDSTSGPNYFELGHPYVFTGRQLADAIKFFRVEARSGGRTSNRIQINFDYL